MNSKNAYLIIQPIFGIKKGNDGKKIVHHSSIINFGEDLGDGRIKYVTQKGEQICSVFEFEDGISILKFDSICLENLMSKWKKINNCFKPIVLDETINTFEIFEDKFSPMNIMVERREDCVAIKPVFN